VNGGVVDMRCLSEDGAEGACPARNLEGDVDGTMSLPEESGTEKQKPPKVLPPHLLLGHARLSRDLNRLRAIMVARKTV
jgi:hypothetical protein